MIDRVDADEPLGYVDKKGPLAQMLETGSFNIQMVLRQLLVLSDSTTTLNAIELFRQNSTDYALVVDELGAVLGMVIMKNLFETIAGRFPGEFEYEEESAPQKNADESPTVNGSLEHVEPTPQLNLSP